MTNGGDVRDSEEEREEKREDGSGASKFTALVDPRCKLTVSVSPS